MAKQLNVNLGFTADTSQAKAQIQQLQRDLKNLTTAVAMKSSDFQMTEELQAASKAAAELSVQLQRATNVNTGNLDLTKFSASLKSSGMSLEAYQKQLQKLGPEGKKAFSDLANSITLAEVPLRRSNAVLTELWTSLKNTARWQISSSILHGFMGAIQSAYGYAQDLNESLNNIRIVTNASIDDMGRFASEANRAAKALSTTTTEYTNASLIYYQQGLSDEEVKKRTDITIKMANAAGESAEKVSDQLTAVWNNFYDGTKSLEHYADVMTALGAKTASSTDEIAGGLEKFAAVADTIGLSYEYAASALATITSNTRESEEVVGTALKTLFSRIQGLQLGETLEDGVDLNKYSEALATVGINILDTNGELKKMDIILDEMGSKWDTLSKSQQVALAETVAGVRQYNQLVALMDNWDSGDSDSFQANLDTARNSQGALQEQADIYAESWEAANNRVRASAEAVYSALLNDEFFIDLTNGFGKLLDGVKSFIDGLGGVKGVLLAIGSIVTRVFSKQIGESLSNMAFSLKGFFNPKAIEQQEFDQKQKVNNLLITATDDGTTSGKYASQAYAELGKQQVAYINNAERMSEVEQATNQILMDRNRTLAEQVKVAGEALEKAQQQVKIEKTSIEIQTKLAARKNGKKHEADNIDKTLEKLEKLETSYSTLTTLTSNVSLLPDNLPDEEFNALKTSIERSVAALAGMEALNTDDDFKKLGAALGVSTNKAKELYQALTDSGKVSDLEVALSDLAQTAGVSASQKINNLRNTLKNCGIEADVAEQMIQTYVTAIDQAGKKSLDADNKLMKLKQGIKGTADEFNNSKSAAMQFGQAISQAASAIMAVGQFISTVQGVIDTFTDSEATAGEKIMALVSGLGMMIPAIMSIVSAFSKATTTVTIFGTAVSVTMRKVTLIVGAIAAVVGAIALIATAESKAEKAAKAAAEAAEDLANAADDAKNALENLQSAFDTYDEAVDKLNSCTRGTEEWDAALQNVNSTVLELLSSNSSLMGYSDLFTRNAEGMLEINEAMRDTLLTAAEQKVLMTEAAAMFGSAAAQTAAVNANIEQVSSHFGTKDAQGKRYYKYEDIKYLAGDADSFASMATSEIKTAYIDMESILANNLQSLAGLTEEEFRDKIRSLLLEQASEQERASSSYLSLIDSLVDKSTNFQNQIDAMANSANQAANKMLNTARILADQQLGDKYTGEQKDVSAVLTAKKQQEYYNAYVKLMKHNSNDPKAEKAKETLDYGGLLGIAKNDGDENEIYQFIANQLAGYNLGYSAATGNTVQHNDDNRTLTFLDANGKRVTESAEYWASLLASAKALQDLGASAEEASKTLTHLRDTVGHENEAEGISGLITNGNLYNLTGAGAESMESAIGDVKNQDHVINYLKNVLDEDEEGLMTYFNVDSIKAVYDKFYNAWQANERALADASGGWIDAVQDWRSKNEAQLHEFTAASQSQITQSLTEAFIVAGSEGMNALGEVFEAAGADADDLQNLLNEVDWTDPGAVDQLNAAIKEQGLNIDTTSEAWKIYTAAMSNASSSANNVIYKFNSVRDTIISVQQALDGLEMGSIISDEEYAKLLAMNPAIKELFGMAANGYKFLGDTSVLEEMLVGNTKQSIQEVKTEFENLRASAQKMSLSYNFDDMAMWSVWEKAQKATKNWTGKSIILDEIEVSEEALTKAAQYVQEHMADATSTNEDVKQVYEEQLAIINKYYNGLNAIRQQYLNGQFESSAAEEVWASSLARGVKDLTDAAQKGAISWQTYNKYLNQVLSADLSQLKEVQEALISGSELTDEQSKYLDNLEAQWTELGDIAERGSKEYLATLAIIEDTMQQIQLNSMINEVQTIDIDVNSDLETFENQIDKIVEKKREIIIQVTADEKDAYEDYDKYMSKISGAAGLIGEGFKVSRDALATLGDAFPEIVDEAGNVFPGILDKAYVAADGMIQLDAETVKSRLGAEKELAMSAARTTLNELREQKKQLDNRITTNKGIISTIETKVLKNIELTDAETQALKDYDLDLTSFKETQLTEQTENRNKAKDNQIQASDDTKTAEEINAELSSTAWGSAYSDMMRNAVTAANQMITAANTIGQAYANAAGKEWTGGVELLNYFTDPLDNSFKPDIPIDNTNSFTTNTGINQFSKHDDVLNNKSIFAVDADGNIANQNTIIKNKDGTVKGHLPELPEQSVIEELLDQTLSSDEDVVADPESEKYKKWMAIIQAIKDENSGLEDESADLGEQILAVESWLKELENQYKNVGLSTDTGDGGQGKDGKLGQLKEKVDIYADIDAKIADINHKLKEQQKITQHAETDEDKIESLEQEAELIDKLNSLYKEKEYKAQEALKNTRQTLEDTINNSEFDIDLEFEGDVLLGEAEALQNMINKINAMRYDIDNGLIQMDQEAAEQQLADLEAEKAEIEALILEYGKTLELLRQIQSAISSGTYDAAGVTSEMETIRNPTSSSSSSGSSSSSSSGGGDSGPTMEDLQKQYYEKIQKEFEADLSSTERELERIDFYLDRISDDFYSMAEAAELMKSKVSIVTDNLAKYENFYNKITADYKSMAIGGEDFEAGLQESYDGIMDQLSALVELDKEMMHYYEDTLAAGAEELAYYTDQMEHLTSVLDHYANLVSMINGEYDYKSLGTILEGKASNLKNEMNVALSNYEMLLRQQALIKKKYDEATTEEARELHEAELRAVTNAVNEAHETMLSKTEEWAEAEKAIVENAMAEAARSMEMAFSGGLGFDTVSNSLSRLSTISDEYYTKTNQLYETQKLLNQAQQEIDKTTNNAAKVRLKNYMSEINALKEKNKLSKLDLSIAKAKYDVLLAEIALEEAQNAKATVRLQRDSEGNYGYVYTADQNAIAQAQQKLADTQNALYNVGLEGANNYGQKLIELQQQLADDLVSLEEARAAGQFETDEAYFEAKNQLIQEYYDLFEVYADSYNAALEVDLDIQQEAWITTYDTLIAGAENWQEQLYKYTNKCEESYSHYRDVVQSESEVIQELLNNINNEVNNITEASKTLSDVVEQQVIKNLQTQYDTVSDVTEAYGSQRDMIKELIGYYNDLATAIGEALGKQMLLNAAAAGEGDANGSANETNDGKKSEPTGFNNPKKGASGASGASAATGASGASGATGKINSNQDMIDLVLAISRGEYGNQNPNQRFNAVTGSGPKGGYTAEEYYKAQSYVNQAIANEGESYRSKGSGQAFIDEVTRLVNAGGYASGGYTGSWGPEGRLAMLHEKELVLNKADTENFLLATNLLRDIVDVIDLNSLYNQTAWLSSVGMTNSNKQTLEQIVSIEANFPNVSNRNEIEQAFNNLINTAAQYANRKI